MSFKDMLGLAGKLPETAKKLTELARDRSAEWAERQALTPEGVNEAFAEAFRCGRIGCACRGVFRAAVPRHPLSVCECGHVLANHYEPHEVRTVSHGAVYQSLMERRTGDEPSVLSQVAEVVKHARAELLARIEQLQRSLVEVGARNAELERELDLAVNANTVHYTALIEAKDQISRLEQALHDCEIRLALDACPSPSSGSS